MAAVVLECLENYALAGINLEVEDGELLAVVGPSGAGKSTMLHAIAGLTPYRGTIRFDGRPVDRLRPHERQVGVVFQDLFLFPHLTVRDNLTLAMKRLALHKKKENVRSTELLARFGLKALAERRPDDLSGGEKQRVALARAVASVPRILLLDEPLSSLDVDTAQGLRLEIRRFQQELGITTLLVTHNLQEAAELGDRIAVIRAGELVGTLTSQDFRPGDARLQRRGCGEQGFG